MPEYITEGKISKVFGGATGESEHGPWKIYNLYVEGDDRKFSQFVGEGKPAPEAGKSIKMMEYEIKNTTKGDKTYVNYNVKSLVFHSGEPDKPSSPEEFPPIDAYDDKPVIDKGKDVFVLDKDMSFYISYAKDILVGMMGNGMISQELSNDDLVKMVVDMGKKLHSGAKTPF